MLVCGREFVGGPAHPLTPSYILLRHCVGRLAASLALERSARDEPSTQHHIMEAGAEYGLGPYEYYDENINNQHTNHSFHQMPMQQQHAMQWQPAQQPPPHDLMIAAGGHGVAANPHVDFHAGFMMPGVPYMSHDDSSQQWQHSAHGTAIGAYEPWSTSHGMSFGHGMPGMIQAPAGAPQWRSRRARCSARAAPALIWKMSLGGGMPRAPSNRPVGCFELDFQVQVQVFKMQWKKNDTGLAPGAGGPFSI